MSNAKFSVSISLIFLGHIGICTLSLYVVSEQFVSFDINYDKDLLWNAIFGVAASALVISVIFARANFSFGYFAGLYFSTSILGYVWLSYFSQFPYDHQVARISAVVSLITFLIPALWSPSHVKRRSLPRRYFLWIPPSILFVSAIVLAWALFYGWALASLSDASDVRSALLPETPTLQRYAIGILTGALLPFAFACYFFSRKWILAAIALCLIFGFYPVTLSKIVVLSPMVMIFFWLLAWVFGARVATILSMTIPTVVGLIAFVGFDKIIPLRLINLRFMAVPASALDHYNDFFSSHGLTYFCQMSFVKHMFGCTYDEPLSILMERAYHLGNYNASLFSTEGLASVGARFAPIATFCCGLIFALGNWASQKLPPIFVLVSGSIIVIILLNVPLSTTLVTNGGAFLLLLWYVTPTEFFANNFNAYDLDVASRRPGLSSDC
jgi:hypothetical protein